ncbi:MAG: hypothetical protein LBM93_05190 [Oscillospiraceae bacterium]|jgi:glucan phosphoethanolaminetransferase (alkaline phosphatase superfamily)|nr:hypothetical protein [Oscillospiraceae bacterium]
MKVLNIISAILFLISSCCLLGIPFLNLDDEFPKIAYWLAGAFWGGLFSGLVIQIFLSVKCRKKTVLRKKDKIKSILGILFLSFLVTFIVIMIFFNKNEFLLPINLFTLATSAELYFVVKRTEHF